MSLINQMLQDLEKRREKKTTLPFPTVNFLLKPRSKKKYTGISLTIFIGVFLASFFLFYLYKDKTFEGKKSLSAYSLNKPLIVTSPRPGIEEKSMQVSHLLPALLTGITLQIEGRMTSVHFSLSQATLYRVNFDRKLSQLIIYLDQTRLVNSLPNINYENSALRNMQIFNMPNGDLKIILTFNFDANVQMLQLNDKVKFPELHLRVFLPYPTESLKPNKEEENTAPAQTVVKKLVVNMFLQEEYQKALHEATRGATHDAIQILKKILLKQPNFYAARESLIKLLLQRGDRFNADKYLTLGLHLHPRYIPFIELHARLLSEEGKVKEALTFLKSMPPSIMEYPDYHALIAALYQQLGNSEMAAKMYHDLLKVNSNKAVWWVGLGIALEALDKRNDALQAFDRAKMSEGLTPELSTYVNDRIESV